MATTLSGLDLWYEETVSLLKAHALRSGSWEEMSRTVSTLAARCSATCEDEDCRLQLRRRHAELLLSAAYDRMESSEICAAALEAVHLQGFSDVDHEGEVVCAFAAHSVRCGWNSAAVAVLEEFLKKHAGKLSPELNVSVTQLREAAGR